MTTYSRIAELFRQIRELKAEKQVRIRVGDLVLQPPYKRAKHPNAIYISDRYSKGPDNYRRVYYGRIDVVSGEFTLPANYDEVADELYGSPMSRVHEWLAALDLDPKNSLATSGRELGECCFCSKRLVDPRSVNHGYGPICADKYGLPWKDESPEEKKARLLRQLDNLDTVIELQRKGRE